MDTILVAGGAGFIGSHLCRALSDAGHRVICLDNLQTARPSNLKLLEDLPHFTFVEGDIVNALPASVTEAPNLTRIYNCACAASPPQYQADPEHTMLTNVVGTNHLLRLAEKTGARFLLAHLGQQLVRVGPTLVDHGRAAWTGDRATSARFSASTLTRSSPRKPNRACSVWRRTSASTSARARPRARATRTDW